jgi:hypothetical protein
MYPDVFAAPYGQMDGGVAKGTHELRASRAPEAFVARHNPLPIQLAGKSSLTVSDPKTRRFYLGALTAASAVRVWGANDKVNVGILGLGGRGTSHLNTYTGLNEAQVVGSAT